MDKKELDKLIASATEAHSKVTDFLIKVNTIYRKYYHLESSRPAKVVNKDTTSVSLDSDQCAEMSIDDHFDGEGKE